IGNCRRPVARGCFSENWHCRFCMDCARADLGGRPGHKRLGKFSHRLLRRAGSLSRFALLAVAYSVSLALDSAGTASRVAVAERIHGIVSGDLGVGHERSPKSKVQGPKFEVRNPKSERRPKPKTRGRKRGWGIWRTPLLCPLLRSRRERRDWGKFFDSKLESS